MTALLLALYLSGPSAQEAPVLERQAGVVLENATITAALSELHRASGISFSYSSAFLPADARVTCDCRAKSIAETLNVILREASVQVSVRGTTVALIPEENVEPTFTSQPTSATLLGRVISGQTKAALLNAEVTLSPGDQTAWTGEGGRFRFDGLGAGVYQVNVQALGHSPHKPIEVTLRNGDSTSIEVALDVEAIRLSEIVVTPGTFGVGDAGEVASTRIMTRAQVLSRPQFGEDALRAIRRLPGVATRDVSVRLNVRGAPTQETMITVDGFELIEGYHLQDFEGGFLSVVDVHTLGGMQLFSGGFGVDQGGYSAAHLALRTRTDAPSEGRTQIGLSFTAATLLSQGRFANARGTWLLSARRGYLDLILRDDGDPKVKYYDALGRVDYQFSGRHRLSLHGLIANDDLRANDTDPVFRIQSTFGNGALWASWRSNLDRVRIHAQPSFSWLRKDQNASGFDPVTETRGDRITVNDVRRLDSSRLRLSAEIDLARNLMIDVGGDLKSATSEYDAAFSTTSESGTISEAYVLSPAGTSLVGWSSLRVRPHKEIVVDAGVRVEHHNHTDETIVSPRLMASVEVGSATTIRFGAGEYAQAHQLHELNPADGQDEYAPYQEAKTLSVGIEHRFARGWSARVEGYLRNSDRPQPLFTNLRREAHIFPALSDDRHRIDPVRSRARGLEFILKQPPAGRFDWGINYILSSSEHRINQEWLPADWDQTHALSMDGSFRASANWEFSGAARFRTGWPITPGSIDPSLSPDQSHPARLLVEDFNGDRVGSYKRVDVRVTRRFGDAEIYLDVMNLFNHPNERSLSYVQRPVGTNWVIDKTVASTMMEIIPSLGFRWSF